MKRSDMLSKIASVIINYNEADCIINRDKAMDMAETILHIQEEAGMLPPPDYTETYYSGDEPGGYNPNFWEPEDLPVSKINTEKAIDEMLNALDNDKETKDMLTKLVPDGIKLK